ncbi:MAG: hypothetical protein ACRDK0_07245 [Solirubrobacteraceae bacterium]
MGKRSRRSTSPEHRAALPAPRPPSAAPPATDPNRLLLDAIADGELDHHLTALADAVNARRHLLHTVRAATALAQLCVGDEVRINHTVSPKYLHGVHGRVIDLDDDSATVCLHRPVGRFKSGHVRCPPLALDRLQPHAAAA